jgi:carbonic anhydrase
VISLTNLKLNLVVGLRIALGFALMAFVILSVARASTETSTITSEQALQKLVEGNTRFVDGKSTYSNVSAERRADTAKNGQHPFASVVSCSDSRVPVELLLDQGIGDVFVIRVAGNVCNVDETGSVEYGVDHLGTPVLVVLGHTKCGAVTAVCEGAELHGNIPALVHGIIPAVETAKKSHPDAKGDALVAAAIEANVWQSINDLLKKSPAVLKRVQEGKLKIVGAVYNLEDGHVNWLGEHPEQALLLKTNGNDSNLVEATVHESSTVDSATNPDSGHSSSENQKTDVK